MTIKERLKGFKLYLQRTIPTIYYLDNNWLLCHHFKLILKIINMYLNLAMSYFELKKLNKK